jgi:ABC-type Zn uptake system ZnuABC Zn-binding protein ZnuA
MKVMCYHKNETYFARDFGIEIAGYIEPKPGIPPTPQHVQTCINIMKEQGIKTILVASYFEKRSPESIAQRTGTRVVTLPISVNAFPEITDNFKLVDYWIKSISDAVK